jgi:hypothetical protein
LSFETGDVKKNALPRARLDRTLGSQKPAQLLLALEKRSETLFSMAEISRPKGRQNMGSLLVMSICKKEVPF